jgi:hypothetical protein
MYDHSSVLIVGILFFVLVAATEAGFRLGFRYSGSTMEATKGQIHAIQASLLGVLALLLGFTFSLALQRFDSRSEAVVEEANAIGTTLLRADLLPFPVRAPVEDLILEYLDLRVAAGAISLDHGAERDAVLMESDRILAALWEAAARASEQDPNPATTGLFIQSLNQMIDALGRRDAELDRHVPEPVLFLMFAAFVLTACLVGYTAGVSGHRASFATYLLVTLVTCLIFIVIDLDRPRRGLIEVSQQSLIGLRDRAAAAE